MDDAVRISSIRILPDGVEIGYMRFPDDVRKNGLLWNRTVLVPFASDYEDEIEGFIEAARVLLADALDDEDRAESVDPDEYVDEDEGEDDDAE